MKVVFLLTFAKPLFYWVFAITFTSIKKWNKETRHFWNKQEKRHFSWFSVLYNKKARVIPRYSACCNNFRNTDNSLSVKSSPLKVMGNLSGSLWSTFWSWDNLRRIRMVLVLFKLQPVLFDVVAQYIPILVDGAFFTHVEYSCFILVIDTYIHTVKAKEILNLV